MKNPFGFGRKTGKKYRRDFSEEEYTDEYSEEEYMDDEYEEDRYAEDGYLEDEYLEDEYSDDEYIDDEYIDDEYVDEEYSEAEYEEGEYLEEEYSQEEYSDGEYIFSDEMEFDEIRYEEEEFDQDSYEQDDSYEEYDYSYEEEESLPVFRISGLIDKLVTLGGVAIIVIGLAVGGLLVYNRMNAPAEDVFLNVGSQISGIEMIGESGLMAVADAQKAAIEAAKLKEQEEAKKQEEQKEYEEQEYKTEVEVKLSVSSIEKDLKIKFINRDTGKLVGNVPFGIQVTDPDGKKTFWSDDDMDGIIYKKNIKAGKYTIKVNDFQDVKYKKYGIPSADHKVEVKESIEYKKVDVANEVKTEAQVDVKKEDTKKNETIVENYLADTVTWVESTATLVSYTEVAKENVTDPMKPLVNAGALKATVMSQISGSDVLSATLVITPEFEQAAVYAEYLPASFNITGFENETQKVVLTAQSSDANIAVASVQDGVLAISGVAPGEATVTISGTVEVIVKNVKEDGQVEEIPQTFQAEPVNVKVIVYANPQKDFATELKDTLERAVYVLENQEYRPAKYADYYVHDKLYTRGEAKYTGWQTLEGRRFYFDAAGKVVTGEQVIQGIKYNFADDGALVTGTGPLGIDVSKWNGSIDWNAVKKSGVSYVIIRCGYRGSSEGALIKDSKFEENIKGAVNAGLKVGVYFFSQAIDKSEAIEEASMVLECVKNYKLSYPIFLDVEPSGGRADKIDVATRTEICKTFCETIQGYGYTAGIYANKTWFEEKINTSQLSGTYKIWLAQYASEPTYAGRYDLWQYKATGKINGISGDVDLNLSYLGY